MHVHLEDFIGDMKLEAAAHDWMAPEDAKKKLLDEHYKSCHLQRWEGDDFEYKWEKLRIEPGIGRELADNIEAFGHRKKPARALTHIYSPIVSTSRSSLPVPDSIEEKSCGHRQRHRKQEEEDYESEFDLDETTFEDDEGSI